MTRIQRLYKKKLGQAVGGPMAALPPKITHENDQMFKDEKPVEAAVNVVDEMDGPEGLELSRPSIYPGGEEPDNQSGTSEHDFGIVRRVEGSHIERLYKKKLAQVKWEKTPEEMVRDDQVQQEWGRGLGEPEDISENAKTFAPMYKDTSSPYYAGDDSQRQTATVNKLYRKEISAAVTAALTEVLDAPDTVDFIEIHFNNVPDVSTFMMDHAIAYWFGKDYDAGVEWFLYEGIARDAEMLLNFTANSIDGRVVSDCIDAVAISIGRLADYYDDRFEDFNIDVSQKEYDEEAEESHGDKEAIGPMDTVNDENMNGVDPGRQDLAIPRPHDDEKLVYRH